MTRRELWSLAAEVLDDWLDTYASEFCDEKRVAEARQRLREAGGTLAYISDRRERLREAARAR